MRSQAKLLPPKLKRQVNTEKDNLPREETQEQMSAETNVKVRKWALQVTNYWILSVDKSERWQLQETQFWKTLEHPVLKKACSQNLPCWGVEPKLPGGHKYPVPAVSSLSLERREISKHSPLWETCPISWGREKWETLWSSRTLGQARKRLRPKLRITDTARVIALCLIAQLAHFLWNEGKTLHQQRDYNSLYCNIGFIALVWTWTHNIFKVCLYCFVLYIHTFHKV